MKAKRKTESLARPVEDVVRELREFNSGRLEDPIYKVKRCCDCGTTKTEQFYYFVGQQAWRCEDCQKKHREENEQCKAGTAPSSS